MDNSSFLIGIFFLLLFIIPIGWVIYKAKNKIKTRKILVQNLCKSHGMLVEKPEQVGNALIGIDYQNKKMFYTKLNNIEADFIMIPTESITDIRISKEKYAGRNNILQVAIDIDANENSYKLEIYDDKAEDQIIIDAKTCLHEANQWIVRTKLQLVGNPQVA